MIEIPLSFHIFLAGVALYLLLAMVFGCPYCMLPDLAWPITLLGEWLATYDREIHGSSTFKVEFEKEDGELQAESGVERILIGRPGEFFDHEIRLKYADDRGDSIFNMDNFKDWDHEMEVDKE